MNHILLFEEFSYEDELNEKNTAKGNRSPIDSPAIEKALKKKSEMTGVPISYLRIIMRRGMAAWKTGHRPGATQQQWGDARVSSMLLFFKWSLLILNKTFLEAQLCSLCCFKNSLNKASMFNQYSLPQRFF
jgi:hypothetical protein